MLENSYNNDLEIAKSRFNLIDIVSNPKKIGDGTWRVNPCPKCGKKNHFTLYEPNTANNHNGYWVFLHNPPKRFINEISPNIYPRKFPFQCISLKVQFIFFYSPIECISF